MLDDGIDAASVPVAAPRKRASESLSQGRLRQVLGYRLVQASLVTGALYEHCIGEPLGLRKSEYSLLMLLEANAQATPKQLASALALSAPKLTLMLDRLQERGLLDRQRSATDGRSQRVRLSHSGQALLERAIVATEVMEQQSSAALSPGERLLLLELLSKIVRGTPVSAKV